MIWPCDRGHITTMTKEELRATIKHLGLRQVDVAWMAGVSGRQAKRWATGKSPIPRAVALLLLGLADGRLTPTWFRRHIPEPIPYSDAERP